MKTRARSALIAALIVFAAFTAAWLLLSALYVFATQFALSTVALMSYAAIASSVLTVWFRRSEARMTALRGALHWTTRNARVRGRLLWQHFIGHVRIVRKKSSQSATPSTPRLADAA